MDIQDAINIFFAPEPTPILLISLRKRLGNDINEYYTHKQILEYLKISSQTYHRIIESNYYLEEKLHYEQAGELILKIESNLTLEERLFEQLVYFTEMPRTI